jgi:hypothetical protein
MTRAIKRQTKNLARKGMKRAIWIFEGRCMYYQDVMDVFCIAARHVLCSCCGVWGSTADSADLNVHPFMIILKTRYNLHKVYGKFTMKQLTDDTHIQRAPRY